MIHLSHSRLQRCGLLDGRSETLDEVIQFALRTRPRLAYLAQGSFVKYLVDAYGLERFLRLFPNDIASAREVYDKDLEQLEDEWRMFLEDRFGTRLDPESAR